MATKCITFNTENHDVLFDLRFSNGSVVIENRSFDATHIFMVIKQEDWDKLVEFVNEQKEKNG